PISDRMVHSVLDNACDFEMAISGLAVPQIAALIALQHLVKLKSSQFYQLERVLAQAIEVGNVQVSRDGFAKFVESVQRVLDRTKIRDGYELLQDFNVVLLDDEALKHRNYLTAFG